MSNINQFDNYRNGLDNVNLQSLFHKKTERINWKILATVDIDRIIQTNDIRVLKDNIKHLTFCDIESELDLRDSDRNLIKLFKLSQLIVDYLLSSQEYLATALQNAEERCQLMVEDSDSAKRKLQENEAYISDIKRECHRRKKLILAQQQILDSGPNAYHRCPYCEKAFLNGSFLLAHLEKRHADRYIKDWPIIEAPRKKSPKRDHSEEHSVHRDRNIELLLHKLLEQKHSPVATGNDDDIRRMLDAFDKERRNWQNDMGALQREISDLHNKLDKAHSRPKKIRSHLKDLEDDSDHLTKEDIEKARQKAIEDHRKKPIIQPQERIFKESIKKPKKNFVEQKKFIGDPNIIPANENNMARPCRAVSVDRNSLSQALGMSRLSKLSRQMDSIYQTNTLSISNFNESRDITLSIVGTNNSIKESNNNDCSINVVSNSTLDSCNTSDDTESLPLDLQSTNNSRTRQYPPEPEYIPDIPIIEVPISIPNPRQTQSSPVQRDSMDRKPVDEALSKSSHRYLENLDNLNIDYSQDLIEKFCDEVRHMLDDHLELHGIQRGTTGISGAVLQDKMKLMDHEESQLRMKYPNYADIRRRLETEVEQEAHRRLQGRHDKPQQHYPTQDNRKPERVKPHLSSRSLQSSHSEWDEESHDNQGYNSGSPTRMPPRLFSNENDEYRKIIEQKKHHRSPVASPERKNVRISSDVSNTIDSSAWQTESKAVTSVAHATNTQRPTLTNRSSDYDDESDFSK